MFRSLEKNPLKISYDGVDKDEQILYVIRQSFLVVVPSALFVVLLLVIPVLIVPLFYSQGFFSTGFLVITVLFWYLFVFGYFFQILLNWYFNIFIITNKKIVDMDFRGLMYKNISETTLHNIEDVTSTVIGAFGTIFNIGNVSLQTAAEMREFSFENVDNPSEIRDIIADLIVNKKHGNN